MLQAHSFLWNYLWIAPNLLLLGLAVLLRRRDKDHRFSSFLRFAVIGSIADLARFAADVLPFVSPENYWRFSWAEILLESFLIFAAIGEVFWNLLGPYPSLSRMGSTLVKSIGAALVLVAVFIAALSHDGSKFPLVSGFHIVAQTVFIVELGLVVSVFLFASHFGLSLDRFSFGIILGFGISSCEHLAAWAVLTNSGLSATGRTLVDLLGMVTSHFCVLLWYYYLLVPAPVLKQRPTQPTDHNLDLWNRELERLLHR